MSGAGRGRGGAGPSRQAGPGRHSRSWPLLLACAALLCTACAAPAEPDYRAEMRSLVMALASAARVADPDFLIVPQNGQELATADGEATGVPETAYLSAVDGTGREDLNYGYLGDDLETPATDRERLLALCRLWKARGKAVLVTDYCGTAAKVSDSYLRNTAEGFLGFAADSRDLDSFPARPAEAPAFHGDPVTSLAEARTFLYLINGGAFADKTALLEALSASSYDLLILDLYPDGTAFTPADIAGLRTKASGGSRLILAYLSIGEAEDYRWYWKPAWGLLPPSWLGPENPDWPGNYRVEYWDPAWQALLFGGPGSYLDRILEAGFDGAYLDLVDAFEYWEG